MTSNLPVPEYRYGLPADGTQPLQQVPWSRAIIKEIAMDIGKEIAAYVEVMYPKAVEATSSTFLTSVRNSIFNEIMAAIEVNDAGQIAARVKDRKSFRRQWKAAWKKIRASTEEPDLDGAKMALMRAQQGWIPVTGECFNVTFTPAQRAALLALLLNGDGAPT